MKEYFAHVKVVMALRENKLFLNLKKCDFFTSSLVFLGFVISSQGIAVDPKKIQALHEWQEPTNVHEVRSFHVEDSLRILAL